MKTKLIFAMIIGGVAAIFSFLDSAGQALSDNAPAMASRFDPSNEIANQRLITQLLKRYDDERSMKQAAELTRRTARTAPGLAPILRSYAILAETKYLRGDTPALMQMAQEFSKRDLPTQLWLIEQRAASGDIEGTLAYYDSAMRTNPEVRALLYPILGRAVSDPELIGPIAKLLRTDPPWAPGFFRSFASDKEALVNFPALMTALGDDSLKLIPIGARTMASTALINAGHFDSAETVALFGMDKNNLSDFSNGGGRALPPFGWDLVRSGTVSASVTGRNTLMIEVGRGAGGVAARRLVRLNGGALTIHGTMTSKTTTTEQLPRLQMVCNGKKKDVVIILPTKAGPGQYRFSDTVTIPQCPFAELSIRVPGNFVDAPLTAEITTLGMK